ncbi:hypothetical protein F5Y12DRAFT_799651 [Xylaria sp. FL1777]|nr:hypothetical protein F5Y12DRAFT_799651 [Xylaria sp. FL1777]
MSKANDRSGATEGVDWLDTPLVSLNTGTNSGGSLGQTADLEHDLYLEAITQLEAKVDRIISRTEFDSFVELSQSCTTLKQAKFEFEEVERECHARLEKTSFHRFFHRLNALFEPLELIANALDTLCQTNSTFSLIWGSLKVLISVAREVSSIPVIVIDSIKQLRDSFPTYNKYKDCLSSRPQSASLLRPHLVDVYVEYLTFCIHVKRVSASSINNTLRIIIKSGNPFQDCIKIISTKATLIHQLTSAMIYAEVGELHEKMDAIFNAMSNPFPRNRTSSQASTIEVSGYRIVPSLLSHRFTGRADELSWLENKLTIIYGEVIRCCVGIHGMTGVGKTQLMLEYEKRHRDIYYNQFFLSAGSNTKLAASCQEVLQEMDLAPDGNSDDLALIQLFFRKLSKIQNWLLLIDNVGREEVDTIQRLLPVDTSGHVIVSSQFRLVTEKLAFSANSTLELKELALDEAVKVFMTTAGCEELENNLQSAAVIVKELGFLPHAIDQVASYVKFNNLDLDTFLARYHRTPNQVLDWDDDYAHQRVSIAKHFRFILDTLEQSHPDSLEVLRFYSILEPEAIPLFDTWGRIGEAPDLSKSNETHLLQSVNECENRTGWPLGACWPFRICLGPRRQQNQPTLVKLEKVHIPSSLLEEIFQNEARREAAIGKLWDLNLVRRVSNNRKCLWMHDLTRVTVRASVPSAEIDKLILNGLRVMHHMFPVENTLAEDRAWVDLCLPQCRALINQAKIKAFPPTQYATLLALSGQANVSNGAVVTGLSQLEEAKPVYENNLGLRNARTVSLIHKLAQANKFVGNMRVSEKLHRQAYQLQEETLGPQASETLEVLNDLASVIERSGRLKDAEVLFKLLYQLYEARGHDNPNTMAAAHNLGLCYHNQGRLNEAEHIYHIALQPSEQKLGIEDVGTLKTLSNLATTVDHQGRLEEAQGLYEKALPSFIKVLGFDHFLTIRLRCNLAALRRQQGAFKQAEEMVRGCLDVLTQLYGRENHETIAVIYDLGEVLHAKGDLESANKAFEEVISLSTDDLEEHPVTFRFLDASGVVLREMGDLKAAETMSKTAYDRFNNMLGWVDPYTLVAANDYGELLHAQGKYEDARQLYGKCKDTMQELLGERHPHYLMVTNNLGRLCWAVGNDNALAYFDEAHRGLDSIVGSDHFCTLTIALNRARTRAARGDFEYAESSITNIQSKLRQSIAHEHPLVFACDLVMAMVVATKGGPESLTLARDYFTRATDQAQGAGFTHSADYYLGICLLVLVLKLLGSDEETVKIYTDGLDPLSDAVRRLSPWNIPGHGAVSAYYAHEENYEQYY